MTYLESAAKTVKRLALILIVAAIALTLAGTLFLYYWPQKLPYSSYTSASIVKTPQEVTASTDGNYVTLHYFSGFTNGQAIPMVNNGPTLSRHGNKIIKMTITLQFGDATVGDETKNEYSFKILRSLTPGTYHMNLNVIQLAGLSAGPPPLKTYTTTFEIK